VSKRVRTLSILVVVALWAAACGDDDTAETTTTQADTTTTQASPTPAPEPSGDPIVVGGTLALTGAVGATGTIHRIAGQLYVERLNAAGGLLGRPVVFEPLDDESDPTRVGDLYEQLISQDGVDLIMAPYATPWILQAQPVAERHGFVLPQHTSVLAPAMSYRCQFPAWSIGPEPNVFIPNQVADALDSLGDVATVALVTNSSGSTAFVSHGVPDVAGSRGAIHVFPERGYQVVADETYPPGNTEWGSIAVAIRAADPDFVMVNGLGIEANGLIDAMSQLDYSPRLIFALFPAPGAVLAMGEAAEGMLSVSMFEPNEPILAGLSDEVREIVAEFEARAAAAGLPYTTFETQAAASWNAWDLLTQGVAGAGSLDHEAICDYLLENGANLTFAGQVSFLREDNNFWPTNQVLKQVQDGDWVVVWPADRAAAPLRGSDG
jgi:branched-chain amino acid transport system substrate-binding protein